MRSRVKLIPCVPELNLDPFFLQDYVAIPIIFPTKGGGKICARGIYQKEEERIIFCSKEESRLGSSKLILWNENENSENRILIQKKRGICYSYAFKENKVFLTEIYNRPQSTLRGLNDVSTYYKNGNGVFGLTFQNRLVCNRKWNYTKKNFRRHWRWSTLFALFQ